MNKTQLKGVVIAHIVLPEKVVLVIHDEDKKEHKLNLLSTNEAKSVTEGDAIVWTSDCIKWTPKNKWGSSYGVHDVKLYYIKC